MQTKQKLPANIDQYIGGYPQNVRVLLENLRATIRRAAPDAEEVISYRIPTFRLEGNLVHFAAFRQHIGFYPTSTGIAQFKKHLSAYKNAKGSVQFPLHKPIPYGLVRQIVEFRVRENLRRAEGKRKKKRRGR